MMLTLYMATTNDEFELPCMVSERACDVAKFVGMTVGSFHSALSRHIEASDHNGYHIYRVKVED